MNDIVAEKKLLKRMMMRNLCKAQTEMTKNYTEFLEKQDRQSFEKYVKSFGRVQSITKTLDTMIKGV